jgi:hypothetical protein
MDVCTLTVNFCQVGASGGDSRGSDFEWVRFGNDGGRDVRGITSAENRGSAEAEFSRFVSDWGSGFRNDTVSRACSAHSRAERVGEVHPPSLAFERALPKRPGEGDRITVTMYLRVTARGESKSYA